MTPPAKLEIKLTPVSSSTIDAIGHHEDSKTMEIRFKSGAVYRYHNVPKEDFDKLSAASLVGTHFIANIKNNAKYICVRMA